MVESAHVTPEEIRAALGSDSHMRARDLAEKLGISEAQLLAAQVGSGVTRISAKPDDLMPHLERFGEVMALTRTKSVVHEKIGVYDNYVSGDHASMVLSGAIDLRIFAAHWVHGFAVERETEKGHSRSIQIFDAAGDAVHKIHLRSTSDQTSWPDFVAALRLDDQGGLLRLKPRKPTEGPKINAVKAEILQAEWRQLTDTHQFLRLTRKLKMNRLGAYRIAGAPFVRSLAPDILPDLLTRIAAEKLPVMIFVGNQGCIQIHSGLLHDIKPMGPWQNVMDPDFNLHLRADHVAEVWAVDKPTQRGPAVSVEAFDAEGALILQIFGVRKEDGDFTGAWRDMVATLPSAADESESAA